MSTDERSRRRALLKNLVVMAFADGTLGQREVNVVAHRCAELGLDESDLRGAIEDGISDNATIDLPDDEMDRVNLLKDLIRVMAADGVLDESEKRLFAMSAARMNLSATDIEAVIDDTLDPPLDG